MLLPLVRGRARLRSCDHSRVVSLLRQSDRDPIQGCRRAQARSRYPVQVGERCGRCCAEEALREKAVLPRCFKDENRIQSIKGIYVPFFLFDYTASGISDLYSK